MEFTGSLIVVPDISIATAPGERITTKFGEASSCSTPPESLGTASVRSAAAYLLQIQHFEVDPDDEDRWNAVY